VQQIRDDYREGMALRAPVTYWEDKRKSHTHAARLYGGIFLVLLCVLGLAGYELTVDHFLPMMRQAGLNGGTGAFWPLALFSVAVAVLAWPLRLLSKIHLSHRHLAEDASERKTIVETFLALKDEAELGPEDRQLLLAAIFRESSAGLVNDEGSLSPLEYLAGRTNARA
jgi:hypothetical protein